VKNTEQLLNTSFYFLKVCILNTDCIKQQFGIDLKIMLFTY